MNSVFESSSMRSGYTPILFGADRHGSFVWEATNRHGQYGLTRSIAVSLTPRGNDVVAEAWAVASKGERFIRRATTKPLSIEGRRLYEYVTDRKDGFWTLILEAVSVASEIREEDLRDSYSLAATTERPDRPDR